MNRINLLLLAYKHQAKRCHVPSKIGATQTTVAWTRPCSTTCEPLTFLCGITRVFLRRMTESMRYLSLRACALYQVHGGEGEEGGGGGRVHTRWRKSRRRVWQGLHVRALVGRATGRSPTWCTMSAPPSRQNCLHSPVFPTCKRKKPDQQLTPCDKTPTCAQRLDECKPLPHCAT